MENEASTPYNEVTYTVEYSACVSGFFEISAPPNLSMSDLRILAEEAITNKLDRGNELLVDVIEYLDVYKNP